MPMLVEFEPPTCEYLRSSFILLVQQKLALGLTARTVQCPD
jgi:hypothetical protein